MTMEILEGFRFGDPDRASDVADDPESQRASISSRGIAGDAPPAGIDGSSDEHSPKSDIGESCELPRSITPTKTSADGRTEACTESTQEGRCRASSGDGLPSALRGVVTKAKAGLLSVEVGTLPALSSADGRTESGASKRGVRVAGESEGTGAAPSHPSSLRPASQVAVAGHATSQKRKATIKTPDDESSSNRAVRAARTKGEAAPKQRKRSTSVDLQAALHEQRREAKTAARRVDKHQKSWVKAEREFADWQLAQKRKLAVIDAMLAGGESLKLEPLTLQDKDALLHMRTDLLGEISARASELSVARLKDDRRATLTSEQRCLLYGTAARKRVSKPKQPQPTEPFPDTGPATTPTTPSPHEDTAANSFTGSPQHSPSRHVRLPSLASFADSREVLKVARDKAVAIQKAIDDLEAQNKDMAAWSAVQKQAVAEKTATIQELLPAAGEKASAEFSKRKKELADLVEELEAREWEDKEQRRVIIERAPVLTEDDKRVLRGAESGLKMMSDRNPDSVPRSKRGRRMSVVLSESIDVVKLLNSDFVAHVQRRSGNA